MQKLNRHRPGYLQVFLGILTLLIAGRGFAQQTGSLEDRAVYEALRNFALHNKASVSNLILKRDCGEMTFTGDFYFAAPVNGRVTGAVFIGEGTFRTEAPHFEFEKENLKRFLNADIVESDFKTAVLRFTDDTFDIIGKESAETGAAPADALNLAKELEPRLLKETGANISARLAVSLANNESPGVFLAQFDKGKLNRFTYLVDPQGRILNSAFRIDSGEKVVVFRYDSYSYANDLWIATYSKDDFDKGRVSYPDEFDLVNPENYRMEIDLRQARRVLKTKMRIDFVSLADDLRAVPMIVNDGMSAYNNKRLDESMRVLSAQYDGRDIPCIQEDWEIGLTFLLPKPMKKGEKFSVKVALDGDFIDNQQTVQNVNYPQGNSSWYPRYGFLKRSTFDLIFRHKKSDTISSVGTLVREEAWPDDDSDRLTEFIMDSPILFVTFVSGVLERHSEHREIAFRKMDIDFYSLPPSAAVKSIKEEFVLPELGNVLEYFSLLFGSYPYKDFRATFRPGGSGQGYATLAAIPPNKDEANRETFLYYGSETAQQWWGNIVATRSYRDQWLNDGLSQYSGLLYVLYRTKNVKEQKEFLDVMRYNLKNPPRTDTGVGKGKVAEIGPIILGRRLRTRNTMNAGSMIDDKGTLILRMLHYLFSNPSTGDDKLFFVMMKDFTNNFAGKAASTDNFQAVANAHFVQTPIAQTFGLKDLNWFFQQWVFEAKLPSYRMEYRIDPGEGGQAIISGKIIQENAGEKWFMPLPAILKFPGNQKGRLMVYANGPETDFKHNLPMKPDSVELDPDMWILSEKTETKKK